MTNTNKIPGIGDTVRWGNTKVVIIHLSEKAGWPTALVKWPEGYTSNVWLSELKPSTP